MTEYDLTRRDALKALGAAGVTVAGGAAALTWNDSDNSDNSDDDSENQSLGERERETLHAVAKTVYPSDLSGIETFVDGFLAGRTDAEPERAAAIADAVAELDAYTLEWEDVPFRELDADRREETLRGMGVDTADPDPDGYPRERVRYYVVNELLFALYSSPTGGKLVGLENPQGHPGGTESYRQPPDRSNTN